MEQVTWSDKNKEFQTQEPVRKYTSSHNKQIPHYEKQANSGPCKSYLQGGWTDVPQASL